MTMNSRHAKIEYNKETNRFQDGIIGPSGGADFDGSSPG
jgi:predicted HicB family RNase H-like nuclease